MNTESRFALLEHLLNEALARAPGSERTGYIDAACAGDAELRDELVSLVDAAESVGPLDDVAREAVQPILRALRDDEFGAGTHIGPYELVREIGRGGMGVVFLAVRADPDLPQRVALKLVRRGLDVPELRRRFAHERRIAARLEHPHIARLLDAGITDRDEPWYAMELVEGTPIDRFCDAGQLDVHARLKLFIDVCSAVQYAHANLIVHRDLKPSNILVAADSSVKLLDFGIAKVMDVAASDAPQLTQTGARPMTPEYASPEQIRGEPTTMATDVYSLGVVLYELLVGRPPWTRTDGLPHEIERAICDDDPERPSTAATSLPAATARTVANARATRPDTLRRLLSGDLDAVTLKALEKDTARRYSSVEQLREDIERYMVGKPVRAHEPTFAYRSSRFVRRHRAGVAAAALLFVSIAAGLATTTWQARVAAAERDVAEREAAKSREVSDFLIRLFEVSDPGEARGSTVTARELLDAAATRLDALRTQPDVQSAMMGVIGKVYSNLGQYDDARRLLDDALMLAPDDDRTRAGILHDIGVVHIRANRWAAAESALREALALREARLGATHPAVVATRQELARALTGQERYEEAESLYRQVVAAREQRRDLEPGELASSLHGLATALHNRGDMNASVSIFEQVAALSAETPDVVSPDVASSLIALASVRMFQRRFEEAAPLFDAALAMNRKLYGNTHPDVAVTLTGMGQLMEVTGRPDAADDAFREAIRIFSETVGDTHASMADTRHVYGRFLQRRGELAAAEAHLTRALAVFRSADDVGRMRVVVVLHDLAAMHRAAGRLDRAESLYIESDSIGRRQFGDRHTFVAQSQHGLGLVARDRGDYGAAIAHFREAIAIGEQALRADHPYLVRFREDLAIAERAR